MRRIAIFVLFALLAPSLTALTGSSQDDCCSSGEMSCCAKEGAPDAACGLRRCAPDGESGFVPQLPRAILASAAVVTPFTASRPLPAAAFHSPDSIPPDPQVPPPRA